MNIPKSVGDWTLEVIERLVGQGYLETDYYDFKAELASQDPQHTRRLTNSACAFANTRGGFLVFGVGDLDRPRQERIRGIPLSSDLAKDFGDKIRGASPNINFDFSNPPISIKGTKLVLFVVHIPQSEDRPHVTPEGIFYYRTNEGNKQMSYEQIRDSFLRYEERRTKVKLLFVELVNLQADVKATLISPDRASQEYSLTTLETGVVNSLLPDIYSMIHEDEELVSDLLMIRRAANIMNTKIRGFHSQMALPIMPKEPIMIRHNQDLQGRIDAVLPIIDRVLKKLEDRYSLKRPT